MEFEQKALFENLDYRETDALKRQSIFIETELPKFPVVDYAPVVEYQVWHDDGVPMFANSEAGVISAITSLDANDTDIKSVHEKILELRTDGKWGRVLTVCWAARTHYDTDVFDQRYDEAAKAYIHLGLSEARLLPFESGQELTDMRVKNFTSLLTFIQKQFNKDPETYQSYLDLAAEINAEMICRYPDLFDYNHAMWKTSDLTEGMHELRKLLGATMQNKDQAWKDSKSEYLRSRLYTEFNRERFGRSDAIAELGRESLLLSHDEVIENFERKFSQLDLRTQLVEDLLANNSMIVPHEYPELTYLRGMARDMYLTDAELSTKLSSLMNNRILEVANLMLVDKDTSENLKKLLVADIENMVAEMPETDPRKTALEGESLDNLIQDYIKSEGSVSAGDTDRLIEKVISTLAKGGMDIDKFYISVTDIADRVHKSIFESELRSHHSDTLETLMGYISPFCRYKISEIPDSIIEYTKLFLYNQKSKSDKGDKGYYAELYAALEESPQAMFNLYWDTHEEYYS